MEVKQSSITEVIIINIICLFIYFFAVSATIVMTYGGGFKILGLDSSGGNGINGELKKISGN